MKFIVAILTCLTQTTGAIAASEVVNSFNVGGPYYHSSSVALDAYPHWQAVVMGPIPAVIGAVRFSIGGQEHVNPAIKIVAIVSEDNFIDRRSGALAHQYTLSLMIADKDYNRISANPTSTLIGQKILVTTNSLDEMYEQRCLAGWNITLVRSQLIAGDQGEIRTALRLYAAGSSHYDGITPAGIAFLWAPFTYLAENDPAKAKTLPCPKPQLTNFEAPAFIVARAELLDEPDPTRLAANRKQIATFVAKYLGAWEKAKANPNDAAKRLVQAYFGEGIRVSLAQAQSELKARRPPDLAGQLTAVTSHPGAAAPLAASMDTIMDFMVSTATLKTSERPVAGDLIDSSILEYINNDAALKAIAAGQP